MQLILIRHGIAEDRAPGIDDAGRSLTKEGRGRMARIARGLHRSVDTIDVLASSALRRAQETAKIVAKAYDEMEITTVDALAPDESLEDVLEWLRRQHANVTVAAVGHEPQLGQLATWLLTGNRESHVVFRKGGVCLLEFDGRPSAGTGQLLWAMPPALLSKL